MLMNCIFLSRLNPATLLWPEVQGKMDQYTQGVQNYTGKSKVIV